MIIFDNHLHLRRDGRYIDAVIEFQRAGGTHLVLCQLPRVETVIRMKSYMPIYHDTLRMADEVTNGTEVTVFVTVGPYPVDYLTLRKTLGRDAAVSLMQQGIDEAVALCQDDKAIAVGEIGRPHFEVDMQAWDDSNTILQYGMQAAADADIPVVLHTESMGPEGFLELAEMADAAGLARNRVIKHFSPPFIENGKNHGLFPSVLATGTAVRNAMAQGTRFMMETDYIDDPRRPGAVLGPKTIPKRTKQLLEESVMNENDVYVIHQKNPEQLYGIALD